MNKLYGNYKTLLIWGLGIGDWGLGPIPNPQSPIPNIIYILYIINILLKSIKININFILK